MYSHLSPPLQADNQLEPKWINPTPGTQLEAYRIFNDDARVQIHRLQKRSFILFYSALSAPKIPIGKVHNYLP